MIEGAKILYIADNYEGGCSWYRGAGPLNALSKQYGCEVQIGMDITLDWSRIGNFDLVLFQRPYTDALTNIIQDAKRVGVPVWVDFDDLFFDIPRTNKWTIPEEGLRSVKLALELAELVTVSTKPIAESFKEMCEAKVVRNAFDDYALTLPQKWEQPYHRLFWRGTYAANGLDWYQYGQQWQELNKAMQIAYLCEVLPPFTHDIDRLQLSGNNGEMHPAVVHFQTLPIQAYYDFIKRIKAMGFMKPLADIPFNRAKSNITWIEATYAGAICFAPDWEEWQMPGVVNVTDWNEDVLRVAGDYAAVAKLWQQSMIEIKKNYLLSKVNEKRMKLISKILK